MSNNETTEVTKHDKTSFNTSDKPLRIGAGKPGPGRPKKADEKEARNLAVSALKKRYGSLEKAMLALVDSKEPTLRKLAYEYALGKPAERTEKPPSFPQINLQLVTNNNNPTNESRDNDSIPVSPAEC